MPQITRSQKGEITFPKRKALARSAYLAVESDHTHSPDSRLGLLWPELPTAAADSMPFCSGAWEPGGAGLLASVMVNGVGSLYAVAADGSGTMVPFYTESGTIPDYVGNAGI